MRSVFGLWRTTTTLVLATCCGGATCTMTETPPACPAADPSVPLAVRIEQVTVRLQDRAQRAINYAPTHFDPILKVFPPRAEIEAELARLYAAGCRILLTYDVEQSLGEIPPVAKGIGFLVGCGVFEIDSEPAMQRAIALADCCDFYIVNSEGVYRGDSSAADIVAAMARVRTATGRPVTTAEPWDVLLAHPELIAASDFVCANIYGWWQGIHDPVAGADAVLSRFHEVAAAASPKFTYVRETGFPTAGHPSASVAGQQQYFARLDVLAASSALRYAAFEYADQPWKHEVQEGYDVGPHWGLYDANGMRKTTATTTTPPSNGPPAIRFTFVPARGSTQALRGTVENVDAATSRVVVYIRVGGQWWVKPYEAQPLTTINPADRAWTCQIATGGDDAQADQIAAFIVAATYMPALHTPPAAGQYAATISTTR